MSGPFEFAPPRSRADVVVRALAPVAGVVYLLLFWRWSSGAASDLALHVSSLTLWVLIAVFYWRAFPKPRTVTRTLVLVLVALAAVSAVAVVGVDVRRALRGQGASSMSPRRQA